MTDIYRAVVFTVEVEVLPGDDIGELLARWDRAFQAAKGDSLILVKVSGPHAFAPLDTREA